MDEVWEIEALIKGYEKELETDPDDFGVQLNILSLRRRAKTILARREAEAAATAPAVAVHVTEVRIVETPHPPRAVADEVSPQWLWRSRAH